MRTYTWAALTQVRKLIISVYNNMSGYIRSCLCLLLSWWSVLPMSVIRMLRFSHVRNGNQLSIVLKMATTRKIIRDTNVHCTHLAVGIFCRLNCLLWAGPTIIVNPYYSLVELNTIFEQLAVTVVLIFCPNAFICYLIHIIMSNLANLYSICKVRHDLLIFVYPYLVYCTFPENT